MSSSTKQKQDVKQKKKITKLEKIAELEVNLKLVKEENRRLRYQNHDDDPTVPKPQSPNGGIHSPVSRRSSISNHTRSSMETTADIEKMREALNALKIVTVEQELSLKALREKCSWRRQELEARDATITKLQKLLAASAQNRNKGGKGGREENSMDSASRDQIQKLQAKLLDSEDRNVELAELLEATETKVMALENQLQSKQPRSRVDRQNSFSQLPQTGDDDLTQLLKKELVLKSTRVVELEHELEICQTRLQQMQQYLQHMLQQQQQQQQYYLNSATSSQPSRSFHDDDEEPSGHSSQGDDPFERGTFHQDDEDEEEGNDDDGDDEDWR